MMARFFSLVSTVTLVVVFGHAARGQAVPPAEPALPEYQVEVLVFAHREVDSTEERLEHGARAVLPPEPLLAREPPRFEELDSATLEPDSASPGTVSPDDGASPAFRFRLLRPDELQLGAEYQTLRRLAAYAPLVHGGWVQPGLPEEQARPFDLSLLGVLNPRGTIRLHLGRFLHLKLDLAYRPDGGAVAAGAEPAVGASPLTELEMPLRYRLFAERQARSGELHYFDHPAFGVLVKITPVPAASSSTTGRPAA